MQGFQLVAPAACDRLCDRARFLRVSRRPNARASTCDLAQEHAAGRSHLEEPTASLALIRRARRKAGPLTSSDASTAVFGSVGAWNARSTGFPGASSERPDAGRCSSGSGKGGGRRPRCGAGARRRRARTRSGGAAISSYAIRQPTLATLAALVRRNSRRSTVVRSRPTNLRVTVVVCRRAGRPTPAEVVP